MSFEYKCVAAPERAKRIRGARTRTERVAMAMEELINEEAVNGWEYLRTDLVPVEEKPGLLSQSREVHRAVLIFRRSRALAQPAHHRGGPAPMHHAPEVAPRFPPQSLAGVDNTEEPLRLSPDMQTSGPQRPVPGRRPPG